ncbi:MAG: mechanosensitive ion channel [Desulfovermiculus sp.]|nr:mechanosensitive ion channel [Desulfovermiculus sp.]
MPAVCNILRTHVLLRIPPRLPAWRIPIVLSLLIGTLGLFLTFIPVPLKAQSASQETPSPEVSQQATKEQQSLESLLQAQREALQEQKSQVDRLQNKLPSVLADLDQNMASLSNRLNVLIRLQGFIKNNFKEVVILKRNAGQLQQDLQNALQPATKVQDELLSLEDKIQSRQKDLRNQLALSPQAVGPEKVRSEISEIGKLLISIQALQKQLDRGLQPAQEMKRQIQEFEKLVSQDLQRSWKEYFLVPSFSVFKLSLGAIQDQFTEWRQNLPVYTHLFVLGNFNWSLFLLQVLSLFSLFCVVSLILTAIIKKRRGADDLPLKRLLPAPLFISLALSILVANTFFQSSFQSLIFQTLGQIILGWGLILLLWLIRFSMVDESEFYSNPLRLMWFPFAFSLILQNIILPPILTAVLWIILLIIFIVFFKRHKARIKVKLERVLYRITIFLFSLFILFTLAGWVHISLLLTSLWFVFCVCLQIGNCTTGLLRNKLSQFPENTWGFLGRGLVQGAGMPILWLFSFSFVILWLGMTMGDFQFLNEFSKLKLGWGFLSINLFRLLIVLIGFYLARSGLVVLKSLLQSAAELHESLDIGTVGSLNILITYGVWAIYILLALAFLGLNLTSLTVVAGGLSVGIGFGLQSIFNNFISGIILLFGRSIQPGDVVQIRDLWAEVKQINIRTTEVQTFDRATILMPNSKLISEEITNWTHRQDKILRRKVRVGVAFGTDIELVRRLMMYIADTHPRVLKVPASFVRFADFEHSALEFTLYFFASIDYGWMAESDIRYDIDKIFREYGIQIAYPQRDIHIRSMEGLDALGNRLGGPGEAKVEEE